MKSTISVLVATIMVAAFSGQASNLLINPDFETSPSGQVIPASWTFFAPPTTPTGTKDYWVVNTTSVGCSHMAPQSGTYYWKEWFIHNGTNNVAGLYQTFSSSPGAIYQASGYLATSSCDEFGTNCATWLQVEFLNASTNLIALYKSGNFSPDASADTWFQFQVTNKCDLAQPLSVGDPYFTTYAVTGSVTQLVAPAGTVSVRYRYCYLTFGGEGGSAFLDNAVLNQVSGSIPPVISSLFPQDTMIFVNPSNGISFNVSSPSGFTINSNGIHMTVNGTDVSGSLAISGSASSKSVAYSGLQSNTAYTASISVTDVSNLMVSANIQFQTMWLGVLPPTYLWEAEDWDFANGMYINNPDLCSASGDPHCYFGKVGVQDVDEHNLSGASGAYRASDLMGTLAAGDALRPNLFATNRTDYRIDPFNTDEWVNYTRDWPNSTNWIIGRISANIGDSGSLTLSVVNPDLSTTALGTFTNSGGLGYSVFENIYLKDTNGNNAVVILNGKKTLQLTSGGNLLPNFFMLVAGQFDLPTLGNLYPTGTRPFEYTNALSFTATTIGATFPANGITVNLDGNDISSNLTITGSASVKNVVYASLQQNAIHVAIITATNSLGHGIAVTIRFDTFNETNYMVETEDFDYNGGQYIDPWTPDAYSGRGATTNIDFQHTTLDGQTAFGMYRTDGIPEDNLGARDYLRHIFADSFGTDYFLSYFAGGDWVNYTRVYPAGSYYVYGRFTGDGPFTMYLDQVVSGATTVNQVTSRLGQWSGNVGNAYATYGWVPLTDSGQVAPVAIKLNGLSTLRITTAGLCNPNYFMLVPTTGISLTASRSGNNIVISFPTQTGANYRVFYRTNLAAGSWALLSSVPGNGSVKSATDATTGARRFYKVVSP